MFFLTDNEQTFLLRSGSDLYVQSFILDLEVKVKGVVFIYFTRISGSIISESVINWRYLVC